MKVNDDMIKQIRKNWVNRCAKKNSSAALSSFRRHGRNISRGIPA